MTNYPHDPFSEPHKPNKSKERRKKQLEEVWRRRAIIKKRMRRWKTGQKGIKSQA